MPSAPTVTSAVPATLRQLEIELNEKFFERRDAIRTILITLLARQHGFILGPPGVAKSELLESICKAITGANYWRVLLDRQMGKEEMFGQIDQARFLKDGVWARDIRDTFADCHVALHDEAGNTGPSVMNPALTAMNERRFNPGDGWMDIPLISAFGASNYVLDESMIAMWDRYTTRFTVGDIVEDGNFLALMRQSSGMQARPVITTAVDLSDLLRAINVEVPSVVVPEHVLEALRQLRSDLKAEQITPSTRRWANSMRLLQASAFLDGRSVVDEDDLAIERHVLWDRPDQEQLVERKVMALTSPMTRVAMELSAQLDEIDAEIDARAGTAVVDRAAYGGTAQYETGVIAKKLEQQIAQAISEQRNTTVLEQVREQVVQTQIKTLVQCMNMPADRAEARVRAS